MIWLLTSLALAQNAVFVDEGTTTEVTGPVHVVPKDRMDILLDKVTSYDILQESFQEYQERTKTELQEKIDALEVANERIEKDGEILLKKDEELIILNRKLKRANNRTIVATGVATALVGGAVAAVVVLR